MISCLQAKRRVVQTAYKWRESGGCHLAFTRKCPTESPLINEAERAAASKGKNDFPLKLQTSNNLVFPLAHTSDETPDRIPGVLREVFSRRS